MKTLARIDRPPWLPALVILLAGILYLQTLDNGLRPDELIGGDLITHQYAQVQARPSNAPGYPLYTMLGWLWYRLGRMWLGWGLNPIQILSAYSTLWGLASLTVLYPLLNRPEMSGGNRIIPPLLTLFYAVTYFFWYYSVTTEQYTSAIFQTLLLVWLAFRWERAPTNRTLLLMALVSGTMLANMLTTLFILPPLLYLIFSKRPEILTNIKVIIQTTLAGLIPLVSYVYVYLRGAQHPEWRGQGDWANTGEWFIQFLSTQQGRDELAPGLTWQQLITPEYPALIWGELTWPVLLGGLVGPMLMGRRMAIFFYSTFIIYLGFVTAYRFGNWFQVILPAYPLIVLGFGRLVAWLWQHRWPGLRWLITAALLILLGYRFMLSLPRANQHNLPGDTGLDPGWAILADVAEPGGRVSVVFEEWVALQYLQEIWWAEPHITLIPPGESTDTDYISRRAVEAAPHLIDPATVHPNAVGVSLIQPRPEPQTTLPAGVNRLNPGPHFGEQIQLLGYRVISPEQSIMLYWTAHQPIDLDYTISVRLWQQGRPILTPDGPLMQDHRPVWNTYPTTYWQPGEIIADAYTFTPPLSSQADQAHIIIYRAIEGGFENLGEVVIDLDVE